MAYNSKYTGRQIDALLDSIPDKAGKSDLGTAASKNAPTTGNAAAGQVVLGNDTRLTDSRPASDVPAWAKASAKPTYTANEVGALPSSTKVPTKTSDLTNDSGFLTKHQDLSGYAKKADLEGLAASGMIYSLIPVESEVSLDLEPDNIYELDGDGLESLNLNLPGSVDDAKKGHEIIIRICPQSVAPTINMGGRQAFLAKGSDLSSLVAGDAYEMAFAHTMSGWLITIQEFAWMG